jgi:uncharacterized protein YegL
MAVLPVYIAVDVSASVEGSTSKEIERVLKEIVRSARENDRVVNTLQVGYINFADEAYEISPIADITNLTVTPPTFFTGTTKPAALFTKLKHLITRDINRLTETNKQVRRPAVILLTDGRFGPDWEPAFHNLTEYDAHTKEGFPYYPFIVPLGVGNPDSDLLHAVAHPPFMSELTETSRGNEGRILETLSEMLSVSFVETTARR